MLRQIVQLLFLSIPEAFFLMCFISILYCKKIRININFIFALIIVSFLSNQIQSLGIAGNFLGIVLYYLTFRVFYFKKQRIKLLFIIILAFAISLFIQFFVYLQATYLLNLNFTDIRINLFKLLIAEAPIYLIYLLLLLILKRKCANEN